VIVVLKNPGSRYSMEVANFNKGSTLPILSLPNSRVIIYYFLIRDSGMLVLNENMLLAYERC
jgi:hypothetical protein